MPHVIFMYPHVILVILGGIRGSLALWTSLGLAKLETKHQ
jgi:hypothetical protein